MFLKVFLLVPHLLAHCFSSLSPSLFPLPSSFLKFFSMSMQSNINLFTYSKPLQSLAFFLNARTLSKHKNHGMQEPTPLHSLTILLICLGDGLIPDLGSFVTLSPQAQTIRCFQIFLTTQEHVNKAVLCFFFSFCFDVFIFCGKNTSHFQWF